MGQTGKANSDTKAFNTHKKKKKIKKWHMYFNALRKHTVAKLVKKQFRICQWTPDVSGETVRAYWNLKKKLKPTVILNTN